ncbi:hypothetical protein TNCV_3323881 [Trichonephila clavipes]|nr:hypothetical protein TNCV_3323881 [Trichonephila clavipes]
MRDSIDTVASHYPLHYTIRQIAKRDISLLPEGPVDSEISLWADADDKGIREHAMKVPLDWNRFTSSVIEGDRKSSSGS